jgi:hypothetical protein
MLEQRECPDCLGFCKILFLALPGGRGSLKFPKSNRLTQQSDMAWSATSHRSCAISNGDSVFVTRNPFKSVPAVAVEDAAAFFIKADALCYAGRERFAV